MPRRSTRNLKREASTDSPSLPAGKQSSPKKIKQEDASPPPSSTPAKKNQTKQSKPTTTKTSSPTTASPSPNKKKHLQSPAEKSAALQSRKLASYASYSKKSPFPSFTRPTPEDCRRAHAILAKLHGDRSRPTNIVAPKDTAGCGNSPSVLDALVRTILSQNTSDKNSSRAKRAMDDVYGGSDKWGEIVEGGQPKLQKTIQSGGLSVVKSKVIIDILNQVKESHGSYSLDHLFDEEDDEECMRQMLSYRGIGPKTASCVLLFCLQRQSFAVDTHVHRLTGMLGWRPEKASREEAHAHLDVMIPDEEKYPLHVLLISHGKKCEECKAGGRSAGKCELRKAFRKGGTNVKEELEDSIKQEDIKDDDSEDEKVKKEEE